MNVNITVSPVTGSSGQNMHHVEVIADGYQPAHKLASFVVPCSFEKAHQCGEEIRAAFYRAQVEKKPLSIVSSNGVLDSVPDDSAEVINKAAYAAGYRAREKMFNDLTAKYSAVDILAKNLNVEKETAQRFMKLWRFVAYMGMFSTFAMLYMPSMVRTFFR